MRILIDTQIFLWIFLYTSRISPDVESLLKNPGNEIFLSAASVWEIAVKYASSKLQLPNAPEIFIPDRVKRSNFKRLEINYEHALAAAKLPPIHKDPFDRLLIAQANVENFTLLSSDRVFSKYSVKLIDSETYKI